MKELAEDVEREKAMKDVAEAVSKERAKIVATAEKKATASEKAKALAEKRLADLEAKERETKLKLVEVESLNSAQAEDLANLRVALEGCESKWYNEGFADVEDSVEPVISEARKLAFKEGWFAAFQTMGVPEDSPLKDLDHIPLPNLPVATQKTPVVVDEEETTSLRELVKQIDAHAKPIDLEASSNPNATNQHGRNVQTLPEAQYAPEDAAHI